MRGTRHRRGQVLGLFCSGLSVLALSALMLFPALAQAADSSGIQYSEAPPTATGGQGGNKQQGHNEPAANSSSNKGNSPQSSDSGHSKSSTSSGGSSGKNPSSQTVNAQSTSHDGGTGQGNSGNGSNGGEASPVHQSGQAQPASSPGESGGSSPLVPILIAIAALAAISIGAVMLRARRQRDGRGAPVSPEAS
jgi:cobalamin biosynthesis Mg chelatase CobN